MGWTLVTGGAKGLGAEICIALAKQGHSVVIHYRNSKTEADAIRRRCLALGSDAEVIQGDFATQEGTARFLDAYFSLFPSTDNLVNNIGNYLIKPLSKTALGEWRALFETNVFSPLQLIYGLLPSIEKNSGSILNIGVAGMMSVPADQYATAYTGTKSTLLMITKSLAKEMAGKGVSVNMISPGYLENAVDLPKDLSLLPQGRPILLAEAARLAVFLLDPSNRAITGQNVEIAGGLRL